MTQVAQVYGLALYGLAADERISDQLLKQLTDLEAAFAQEPAFLRLLSSANLPKEERCQILDNSFAEHFHPYVVNFLKILTEQGYIHHFSQCCGVFRRQYNGDNGILPVTVVSAVTLSPQQQEKLTDKLAAETGKTVTLSCRVDPRCLGGLRLDYDGRQVDGTLRHRLDDLRNILKNTVL